VLSDTQKFVGEAAQSDDIALVVLIRD
jgi:hypothetical protein